MLSVVVPSRREGTVLVDCLEALSQVEGVGETIIAAHGETPATCRQARRYAGVLWLECPEASRGDQLNRGAAAARGEALLFLHADTRLPRDGVRLIASALSTPGVVGGAFRLGFDTRHPALDMLAALSAVPWRTAFFGDQAMFCTRAAFESVGGFHPEPLFEDVDLALALARNGRLVRLNQAVMTSARRFMEIGPWRQLARNVTLLALRHSGVPVSALARSYRP